MRPSFSEASSSKRKSFRGRRLFQLLGFVWPRGFRSLGWFGPRDLQSSPAIARGVQRVLPPVDRQVPSRRVARMGPLRLGVLFSTTLAGMTMKPMVPFTWSLHFAQAAGPPQTPCSSVGSSTHMRHTAIRGTWHRLGADRRGLSASDALCVAIGRGFRDRRCMQPARARASHP
jgi:hypothetical protein